MYQYYFYLITSILFFSGCTTVPEIRTPGAPLNTLSILQGYTNKSSTQFTVLVPKGKPFNYFIRAESHESRLELRNTSIRHIERSDSNWAIDKINVDGLEPNRPYGLEIRNSYGDLVDSREFYALNIDNNSVRFAAASCMNFKYTGEQNIMWGDLIASKPQLVFFLGDNVYASHNKSFFGSVTPAAIWATYVQTRLTLNYFRAARLIPTLAIWDDGDYGDPDGNRNYKYRKESAEIFRTFYAQEPDFTNLLSGPGTSNYLIAFQMGFSLMDNRYYRTPNNDYSDESTHWGIAQERWLLQNISSRNIPHWILNGGQFFGAYHEFESYERNHSNNFKSLMLKLGLMNQPLMFLSGDRHLTEVMRIDEPQLKIKSFEITTSPMHAKTYPSPWALTPNLRQIEGHTGKLNFAIIDAVNLRGNLNATVTAFGPNKAILYHRFLSVEKGTKKLKTF